MTFAVDDIEVLRHIFGTVDVLLLDFDGPVCSVFAKFPAPVVADQLRQILAEYRHVELPTTIRSAIDPFEILRYAAKVGDDVAQYVEAAFTAHEMEAVCLADPTPRAHDMIRAWKGLERRLAIVSNNSSLAVETYLNRHGIRSEVDHIAARTSGNTSLLKPSAYLVSTAMTELGAQPSQSALLGDSITDIDAARSARVASIGFANKASKVERLAVAGALTTITSMAPLLAAIHFL